MSNTKTQIIDGFIFYNELDMLEYRLGIMYPYVDAFILVESTRTFVGKPKPLYYQDNKERYAKYADKIIHVVLDDLESSPKISEEIRFEDSQWSNEGYQRNAISIGIERLDSSPLNIHLQPTDIILISDIDEILDTRYLPSITQALQTKDEMNGLLGIRVSIYYYNLCNKYINEEDHCIRAVTYRYYYCLPWLEEPYKQRMKDITQQIRRIKCFNTSEVAGWHLSYFGSEDYIQNKIQQFSHQEFNQPKYTDKEYIKDCIATGKDLFGREYVEKYFKRIEYKDNPHLPPLPVCEEGVNPYDVFPYSLDTRMEIYKTINQDTSIKLDYQSRIIDAFIFYNELDILEYRLSVMYPYVDAIILVESTRTHKGNPKKLYYHDNRERYSKYADKIIHIIADDLIENPKIVFDINKGEQWMNEKHQRDTITAGIQILESGKMGWKLQAKDIIIVSDVDEIVDMTRFDKFRYALEMPETYGILSIVMDMYYYNLRTKMKSLWAHPKAFYYAYYQSIPMIEYPGMKPYRNISEAVRLINCSCVNGVFGWHLSCFGNADIICNKLKEFGHQEYNTPEHTDIEVIKNRMKKGLDVVGRENVEFETVEFHENTYLPPFPVGSDVVNPFILFPFNL